MSNARETLTNTLFCRREKLLLAASLREVAEMRTGTNLLMRQINTLNPMPQLPPLRRWERGGGESGNFTIFSRQTNNPG